MKISAYLDLSLPQDHELRELLNGLFPSNPEIRLVNLYPAIVDTVYTHSNPTPELEIAVAFLIIANPKIRILG